jgi:hypothetical protein
MPRYVVQRTYPSGFQAPITDDSAAALRGVIGNNAGHGVTWLRSYVSDDKHTSFCLYDGPDSDAVRAAATRAGLPEGRITEVTVFDPYFYN